jgi:hypothetical protein
VIAWKDVEDCRYRRASFDWVRRYWTETLPDAEVVVSDVEPFTKARALNDAVRRSSGDVILHSDPDSFVDEARALEALRLASEADGLVVPFDRYLYLSESASADFYASGLVRPDPDCTGGPGGVGNCTVYSRTTWERAGGYDERFGVWGGGDGCFAYAADALVAPDRRPGRPSLASAPAGVVPRRPGVRGSVRDRRGVPGRR